MEPFGEIRGGFTGVPRNVGSFFISYFCFDGGGVDADGSEGFWVWDGTSLTVSEDLETVSLVHLFYRIVCRFNRTEEEN